MLRAQEKIEGINLELQELERHNREVTEDIARSEREKLLLREDNKRMLGSLRDVKQQFQDNERQMKNLEYQHKRMLEDFAKLSEQGKQK
mmetsp:Transcript_18727/g.32014  ORF Transcript_18727/g.32014 Transcript_18727/m.32014 type:complete len:89 (+) Transcript_18727:538-804(+)